MRAHRAARPDRAGLRRCAVADGEDEIEFRPLGKFTPALGTMTLSRIAQRFQRMKRPGVDRTGRIAPGAESAKAARAVVIQDGFAQDRASRSEEHTSELQSLMRISYAVFCLNKKHNITNHINSR